MFYPGWRDDALAKLDATFDVIVIGGGITGAGIFMDAAQRGLNVLLLESRDIGSGTSSRSSKLIHGGLRYLKQMQFRITRVACRERDRMLALNPDLVRPIRRRRGRLGSDCGCTTASPRGRRSTPTSHPRKFGKRRPV
jgi:glycerol-3-phosphate dehydrogenase